MKRHGGIPKYILLNESSQTEKAIYCMVPTIWHPGKGKIMVTVKKDQWLPGVRGEGGMNWQGTEDF